MYRTIRGPLCGIWIMSLLALAGGVSPQSHPPSSPGADEGEASGRHDAAHASQPADTRGAALVTVLVRPGQASGPKVKGGWTGRLWLVNVTLDEAVGYLWELPVERVELRGRPVAGPLKIEIRKKGASLAELRAVGRRVIPDMLDVQVREVRRELTIYRLRRLATAAERPASHAQPRPAPATQRLPDGILVHSGSSMHEIAQDLERILHAQVTDETGIKGKLDLVLPWRQGDGDLLRRTLRRYGLDLVPDRTRATFLVVGPKDYAAGRDKRE